MNALERRFVPDRDLAAQEEPVQRYFLHALRAGALLPEAVVVAMCGRINPGMPLAFSATQRFVGHAFEWRARAGFGPLRPLRVVDRFDSHGGGSTDGWLFGRVRFLHADGPDAGRSAAGRAAAESVWRPWTLLPSEGVAWRADADGALRSVSLQRWGNVGRDGFGYIPFGGDILADARFGDWVVPSRLRIGWWYGHAAVQAVLRRHGDVSGVAEPRCEMIAPAKRRSRASGERADRHLAVFGR